MRYRQFLNEGTVTKDELEMFKSDCAYFFKESAFPGIGGSGKGYPMYRGSKSVNTNSYKVITPRTSRLPKDTPEELHYALDESFNDKFGWNVRSEGVFCTGSGPSTGPYGKIYWVLPIGKFQYVWSSKIRDLTNTLEEYKIFTYHPRGRSTIDMDSDKYEPILDKIVSTYQDNDLYNGIYSKNEISIKCKKYYMVDPDYFDRSSKKELFMGYV